MPIRSSNWCLAGSSTVHRNWNLQVGEQFTERITMHYRFCAILFREIALWLLSIYHLIF